VATTIVVVAIVTVVAGRGRQQLTSGIWVVDVARAARAWRTRPLYAAGVTVWVVLLLAVVGWDANSFAHQAHDLPTLSYYVGRVTRLAWGRALVFAAWLAAGFGIALGCLVRRAPQARGRR
jgi:hypothetical protein